VPNFGYACLCMELRELKPPVFTSRDCIKRTLDEKGLPYLGELCLANCRDLARLIQWNHEHGIRFFRMSSVLWPWMGAFESTQLPQYDEIAAALRFAGDLARAYGQRVTFHPSHFVKLAAPVEELVAKSLRELEAHSEILDLMGFEPSPTNKINIHVGGIYAALGDKRATMQRWADNYRRLSPACRRRVTVENDDVASAFSLEDLLGLHAMCGVPLVFDFHHHRFCPGSLTEEQALRAAVATWPPGVRPVVHWSESSGPGRRPHAHSDYVRGPIDGSALHGMEAEVDVMIESKCKERALLALRQGRVPLDEWAAPAGEAALPEAAAVALRLL
jgi:UV DNA damage endonuclease